MSKSVFCVCWQLIASIVVFVCPASVFADNSNPSIGFVLDGFYKSESTALSHRDRSFGLGHTELFMESPVDDLFVGRLTTVLESHAGETELDIEEAFIDTTTLPLGLSVRAGRFLSQVGYLNGRHTHSDDFVERPAAYRAMLGGHYFDDGLRLNALLPTPFFAQLGVEAFNGRQLSSGIGDDTPGVLTLNARFGGDLSVSSNWQLGLSWLRHELSIPLDSEEGEEHDHEHDHAHSHNAAYGGKNLTVLDAVWKWSPRGNVRASQLVVSAEYLFASDLNEFATDDDWNQGWYLAVAHRWTPQWKWALRYGHVDLKEAHGDHFHDQSLSEIDMAISWSRSHFSNLRLQYSHQDGKGFENINDTFSLQYVMSLGAHGAHEY